MMKSIFFWLFLGVLGLGWESAFAAEVGVTENRIVLGESAPFTGAAAQLGIQYNLGAEVYFDALNAAGGIYGRKIKIITADDKYEANLAAVNTEHLIDEDKVFALFGYVGTPTSNAALPIFTREHVPFFAPFTGAESLRNPVNRYVFNIRAGYVDETEHLIDQLANLSVTDIAVFYQNDAYGQAGLAGVQRAMQKRNLTISATATVERNSTDVTKAVAALLPKQPAVIIQISAYQSCAALIRELKAHGYNGQFYNVSFVGSQALANILSDQGPGVVISQVVPFPWKPTLPIVREFQKAMQAAGKGESIDYSSLEGYIAARTFTEGLRRAGPNLTREGLVSALETITPANFDGGGFDVNFNPHSHSGSRFVELTMILPDRKFRD
ncbi:MAG: ABC transporter substrate-binding protein [Burkholderiaceae bacterium]|jgi:ABC-type branched-subunit amino acid transport system substrate-binding protein